MTAYEGALKVLEGLRGRGHRALLAGGCVRDRLRGVEPPDYDIATSAPPEEVQAAFPRTEAVGAAFGVVLVLIDGEAYEVATFRGEGPYLDGRHPSSVRFVDERSDALRRDFTVNGMFLDPTDGSVLDYVGGRADLEAGVLRAIGDPMERFSEDRLRVLRCVRFACQLGFRIEPATWEAVRGFAGKLGPLAAERVSAELTKILLSPRPRLGLELLDASGLLAALLPELLPMKGCPQPPEFHPEGDVWEHTLRTLQALADEGPIPPELAWGALLHDVGKPATLTETDRLRFHGHESVGAAMARELLARLRLGRDLIEGACALVADHLRFDPWPAMRVSTRKRLLRRPDLGSLLRLHRADCLGSHGQLGLYQRVLEDRAALESEAGALRPPPLVTGRHLIAWGYVPGPGFKAMLEAVEDEQLEGRVADVESARRFLEGAFPPPAGGPNSGRTS